jgi:hypothetical protein
VAARVIRKGAALEFSSRRLWDHRIVRGEGGKAIKRTRSFTKFARSSAKQNLLIRGWQAAAGHEAATLIPGALKADVLAPPTPFVTAGLEPAIYAAVVPR